MFTFVASVNSIVQNLGKHYVYNTRIHVVHYLKGKHCNSIKRRNKRDVGHSNKFDPECCIILISAFPKMNNMKRKQLQ